MYILDYEALKLAKNREKELIRQAAAYRLMRRSGMQKSRIHQWPFETIRYAYKKHDLSRLENLLPEPDI
jgi:hypothetical protein